MTDASDSPDLPAVRLVTAGSGREFLSGAEGLGSRGGRFVSLWGTDHPEGCVYAALAGPDGLFVLRSPVSKESGTFPSLTALFPLASRPERAVRDVYGWIPEGLSDTRPWIRQGDHGGHGSGKERSPEGGRDYPFVRVDGEGVHEIPVGPVHAGIIEPGHFRFQVVGEKVLRMEERLGYTHKGIRGLLAHRPVGDVTRLSSRISGDSAVAFQWAWAQAVECATQTSPPERAVWLRAILLERERIANHLGDLGALGNDAGFAFGLVQFGRLKEDLLRTNGQIFGHRYLMDTICPGGVAVDPGDGALSRLRSELPRLQEEIHVLKTIYDEHGGLQDRFAGTGVLDPLLAGAWGLGGVVGRASGQLLDLRNDHPVRPYDIERVPVALAKRGDVGARVQVRFQEIRHSLAFLESVLASFPPGPARRGLVCRSPKAEGFGWIEGFRGEVLAWVRLDRDGNVEDAHFHDPSWLLWPALERAVPGNLVADFPLINKSFNLSYSGHDL